MTTLFGSAIQETGGGGLPSRESKRNRKTQALSTLLSMGAIGLFLEGCGSSSRTCYSDPNGYFEVSCSSSSARYYSSALPVGSAEASEAVALSSKIAFDVEGGGETSAGDAEGEGLLASASDSSSEELGDADSGSDADAIDDLATSRGDEVDTEDDPLIIVENLIVENLVGSTQADTLEGGSGSDTLAGGAGADTYVFAAGDGADTVVEVGEAGVVNTLKFEGDYQASDFSFQRSGEDGTDLVVIADTDGDGEAENEVTLDGYFVSESSTETAYSIEIQINDQEAFVPVVEG